MRRAPGAVPETKDINRIRISLDLVDDPIVAVQDLAHGGIAGFGHHAAAFGERVDGQGGVKQGVAEGPGAVGAVSGDAADDAAEILYRLRSQDDGDSRHPPPACDAR